MIRASEAQSPALSETAVLITSVLIAGLCSLLYELLISTTASYFLGDSIRQFSITIGVYMAAMGLGAWLSRLLRPPLLGRFIAVEIALGVVGGLSVPLLYLAFAYTDAFQFAVIGLIVLIGVLTGLEVPLLTRIMERHYALKVNLSNVLSMDYLGALLATLAFPFLLLPFLGVFRSAVLAGLVNMAVGFLNLWYFADRLPVRRRRVLWGATIAVTLVLGTTLALARGLLFAWSNDIYGERIVLREQTPYQDIVLTRYQHDLRLYLNGNLQFSSLDEYRYHEALVHIPAGLMTGPMDVLVLGGGDGMAVRELLKYDRVRRVTLVDLDPVMLRLAKSNPYLLRLNEHALGARRVRLVNEDAFVFLRDADRRYDLIISDLPDPSTVSLARLYSREFYRLVRYHLSPGGVFVTQATSPFYATEAFWTIANTLQAAGFQAVRPYHAYVPSFGDWGFVMAADRPLPAEAPRVDVPTRFLREDFTESLFRFAADTLAARTRTVSTIDSPRVLQLYLAGWQYWN